MDIRAYDPGEVIIQKGDLNRDLFFLVEGVVEISTEEESGEFILNEMKPPDMFGDFAFFYGLPRTATAKAKTRVEAFVLKYENFEYQVKELPELLKPIISTLVSRIESRDRTISDLKEEISALKASGRGQALG